MFPPLRTIALASVLLSPTALQAQASVVSTVARTVPAGTGGLEVGPDGALYTSDFGATLSSGPPGTRVYRITPTGEVTPWATGLAGATGNLFLPDGRFLQANIAGNSIVVIDGEGAVTPLITSGLRGPVGIARGPTGYFVANCGGNSVSRFTLEGRAEAFSSDTLLRCPNGIVAAPDGSLYVSNFYNGDVIRIHPDGRGERLATLPGNNNGHLVFGNGVLYVAARKAHQIYEVSLEGTVRLLAGSGVRGGSDGPAAQATLSLPNDLALSADGRTLYFNEVESLGPGDQALTPTRVRALRLPR